MPVKKGLFLEKAAKINPKLTTHKPKLEFSKTNTTIDKIWAYSIFKELKEITKRLTRIEERTRIIEKKLHKP